MVRWDINFIFSSSNLVILHCQFLSACKIICTPRRIASKVVSSRSHDFCKPIESNPTWLWSFTLPKLWVNLQTYDLDWESIVGLNAFIVHIHGGFSFSRHWTCQAFLWHQHQCAILRCVWIESFCHKCRKDKRALLGKPLSRHRHVQWSLSIKTTQGRQEKWYLKAGGLCRQGPIVHVSMGNHFQGKQKSGLCRQVPLVHVSMTNLFSRETKNVVFVDRWSLKQVWLYMNGLLCYTPSLVCCISQLKNFIPYHFHNAKSLNLFPRQYSWWLIYVFLSRSDRGICLHNEMDHDIVFSRCWGFSAFPIIASNFLFSFF